MLKRIPSLGLVALLTIFACAPLFYPGFFYGQSGLAAIYNLADFRHNPSFAWRPGLGLEAPFGDFTLLPFYIGALLTTLGLSTVEAIKLLYGAGFVLSATGTYALVRALFAAPDVYPPSLWQTINPLSRRERVRVRASLNPAIDRAAILAATVYTYFPYHLASTYLRADLGESLAFGLTPWAGLCLWRLVHRTGEIPMPATDGRREKSPSPGRQYLPVLVSWITASSLMAAGLLLASPGLGLLTLLVLAGGALIAGLARFRRPLFAGASAVAPLLVGTLVAWPLISHPAATAIASGEIPGPQMIEFSRLFSPTWGIDPTAGFPAQIGLIAGALGMLSVVLMASCGAGTSLGRGKGLIRYLQAMSLILVVLMLPPLAGAWSVLGPLVGESGRLLFALALPLSALAGSALLHKGLAHPLAAASMVTLTVLGSYSYLSPRFGPIDEPLGVIAAKVGGDVVLLDYQLIPSNPAGSPAEVEQGGELRLRLLWQALRPPKKDYTVFTHLLDGGQGLRGQHDSPPAGGKRPTSQWQTGEVIVDEHILRLDPSGPAGDYVVEVGMYLPQTGERLPISVRGQVDTRIELAQLKVKG